MPLLHVWLLYTCNAWDEEGGTLQSIHMTQVGALAAVKVHARHILLIEDEEPTVTFRGDTFITMGCSNEHTCRYEIRRKDLNA